MHFYALGQKSNKNEKKSLVINISRTGRTKNIVCTSGVKHFCAARATTFSRGRKSAILRPWYKNNYFFVKVNWQWRYNIITIGHFLKFELQTNHFPL